MTQRSLAYAGRSDQAEDRPLDLLAALEHGEKFQEPVFDFHQPEMLLVEDALGFGQIQLVIGLLCPGQGENPVQVMASDGIFGGYGRHLLEAVQLLRGRLFGLGRQGRLLELFAQGADFARSGIGLAEFALDGAQLFAEEEITLGLGDGGGHLGLDLGTESEHLVLAVEHGQQPGEPLLDGTGFEEFLALGQIEVQVHGD